MDKFDLHDDTDSSCFKDFGDEDEEAIDSGGDGLLDLKLWDRDFLALKYVDSLLESYSVRRHATNLHLLISAMFFSMLNFD